MRSEYPIAPPSLSTIPRFAAATWLQVRPISSGEMRQPRLLPTKYCGWSSPSVSPSAPLTSDCDSSLLAFQPSGTRSLDVSESCEIAVSRPLCGIAHASCVNRARTAMMPPGNRHVASATRVRRERTCSHVFRRLGLALQIIWRVMRPSFEGTRVSVVKVLHFEPLTDRSKVSTRYRQEIALR